MNCGIAVPIAGLERTLVDISVRPEYAGGPAKVLSAFRKAKNRVSAELMADILEQAIGSIIHGDVFGLTGVCSVSDGLAECSHL